MIRKFAPIVVAFGIACVLAYVQLAVAGPGGVPEAGNGLPCVGTPNPSPAGGESSFFHDCATPTPQPTATPTYPPPYTFANGLAIIGLWGFNAAGTPIPSVGQYYPAYSIIKVFPNTWGACHQWVSGGCQVWFSQFKFNPAGPLTNGTTAQIGTEFNYFDWHEQDFLHVGDPAMQECQPENNAIVITWLADARDPTSYNVYWASQQAGQGSSQTTKDALVPNGSGATSGLQISTVDGTPSHGLINGNSYSTYVDSVFTATTAPAPAPTNNGSYVTSLGTTTGVGLLTFSTTPDWIVPGALIQVDSGSNQEGADVATITGTTATMVKRFVNTHAAGVPVSMEIPYSALDNLDNNTCPSSGIDNCSPAPTAEPPDSTSMPNTTGPLLGTRLSSTPNPNGQESPQCIPESVADSTPIFSNFAFSATPNPRPPYASPTPSPSSTPALSFTVDEYATPQVTPTAEILYHYENSQTTTLATPAAVSTPYLLFPTPEATILLDSPMDSFLIVDTGATAEEIVQVSSISTSGGQVKVDLVSPTVNAHSTGAIVQKYFTPLGIAANTGGGSWSQGGSCGTDCTVWNSGSGFYYTTAAVGDSPIFELCGGTGTPPSCTDPYSLYVNNRTGMPATVGDYNTNAMQACAPQKVADQNFATRDFLFGPNPTFTSPAYATATDEVEYAEFENQWSAFNGDIYGGLYNQDPNLWSNSQMFWCSYYQSAESLTNGAHDIGLYWGAQGFGAMVSVGVGDDSNAHQTLIGPGYASIEYDTVYLIGTQGTYQNLPIWYANSNMVSWLVREGDMVYDDISGIKAESFPISATPDQDSALMYYAFELYLLGHPGIYSWFGGDRSNSSTQVQWSFYYLPIGFQLDDPNTIGPQDQCWAAAPADCDFTTSGGLWNSVDQMFERHFTNGAVYACPPINSNNAGSGVFQATCGPIVGGSPTSLAFPQTEWLVIPPSTDLDATSPQPQVSTTLTSAVSAGASVTLYPASMSGISNNSYLIIEQGPGGTDLGTQEEVQAENCTGTSFTANLSKGHANGTHIYGGSSYQYVPIQALSPLPPNSQATVVLSPL